MLYRCNNCDWKTDELEDVDPVICDIWERVLPGEIMPQGSCPECRCLVHRHDEDLKVKMAAPKLLAAIKGLLSLANDGRFDGAQEAYEAGLAAINAAENDYGGSHLD